MIRLSKTDLQDIANLFVLANTPKSLLRSFLKTNAVDELRRNCTADELLAYYDKITQKGERSPFVASLTYAVLIALLTKSLSPEQTPDASRLEWGTVIASYLAERFPVNERRIIVSETAGRRSESKITYTSLSSGSVSIEKPRIGHSLSNV